MKNKKIVAAAPLILFGMLILVFVVGLRHSAPPVVSQHIGNHVPSTDLPVMGRTDTRFTTASWRGRPYIVNFFASWCADCKAEHEELMTLAAGQIPIIGVTFKDSSDKASAYLERDGNPFAAVALDDDGRIGNIWGIAGAPETFVIDAHGMIRWHYSGILTDAITSNELMPVWEAVRSGQ